MVMRVTNSMKTQNAKDNIFRISERLNEVQEKLVTGKRINRPSDDPIGMRKVMSYRADVKANKQFIRNSEYSSSFLTQADSVIESFKRISDQARVLAVQQGNQLPNQSQRLTASNQVSLWISEAISLANSQFGSRYIFGGQGTTESPIQKNGTEISYVGDNTEVTVEVSDGNYLGINFLGSDVFASDFDADIDTSTLLSNFQRGDGVPAGSIAITNTLGATSTITIDAGWTVQQTITQINSTGIGVTASINGAADGITLTDSNADPTTNLVVQDVGSGTAGRELGIIGNVAQTIDGIKAQVAVTTSTSVSLLNGGAGITFSDVSVVSGATSGTVSFGSPSTIQDVLDAFNNAGMNLQATLNSVGNALDVTSTVASNTVTISDIGTSTTAEALGLGGGKNLFYTLKKFQEALENNDPVAITSLLASFGEISENLSSMRGTVGARVNIAKSSIDSQTVAKDNSNELVSLVENDDFAASATDLAALEIALNASLATTARIIQPSLVDFLR